MKTYLVNITVSIPYPVTFSYQAKASGEAVAIRRALLKLRKEERVRGKRINAGQLTWQRLD